MQTANEAVLTVAHWRERLKGLLPKKVPIKDVCELLAQKDAYFQGVEGYVRLANIVHKRGGLLATSRTVELLEQLKSEGVLPSSSDNDQ